MTNKLLLVLTTAIFLCSCEYKGPTFYKVQNDLKFEVDVFFKQGSGLDSVTSIQPSTSETIYMFEDINGMRDYEKDFLERVGIDSIYFKLNPDSLHVSKEPMKRNNWEYSSIPLKRDKEGLAGDNIYTFKIEDSDIE